MELPSPSMNESLPPGDWGRAVWALLGSRVGVHPLGELNAEKLVGDINASHLVASRFNEHRRNHGRAESEGHSY